MTFTVLMVCSANICRSPTAAWLCSRRLGPEADALADFFSAGVDAEPDRPWCPTASRWAHRAVDDRSFPPAHSSRKVDVEMVEQADLVLAADRHVSSRLLALTPRSRSHLFRLGEAAHLGAAVTSTMRRRPVQERRTGGEPSLSLDPVTRKGDHLDRLTWLVEEMDAHRGLVPVKDPRGPAHWLLRHRGGTTPALFDIPDAHGPPVRSHTATFRTLDLSVRALVECMQRTLEWPGR